MRLEQEPPKPRGGADTALRQVLTAAADTIESVDLDREPPPS